MTLTLVRHGATEWNQADRCQGRTDVPLSARGCEQAERLRDLYAGQSFDHVLASPLSRAIQTAAIVAGREPEVLDDLIEIDRGEWEGRPMDEVRREWSVLVKVWYEDPAGLAMPGGEAFDDLWARAGRALSALSRAGGTVLACGHKAINRVLIARALGRPSRGVWQIEQPQAGRTILVEENGGFTAERIGDASHLPAELRSDS